MLEFGETPDDWPEDIAICEKGQLGAFGMFDHINLFSELVSQILSSPFATRGRSPITNSFKLLNYLLLSL